METNIASCRKCRHAGEKLFLKGAKCRTAKCGIERRPATPGQHGRPAGTKKISEYGKQLLEKQKLKRIYGLRERQFHTFFVRASKLKGVRGENLLSLLERRLDNVLYRLKMALSRDQARQMIVHGHVTMNGIRVSSPSCVVSVNDEIALALGTQTKENFLKNVVDKRMSIGIKVPDWLELNKNERKGVVVRLPIRADVTLPVAEHLVVELYSK
jgi:small subunit ribosomal protein S4